MPLKAVWLRLSAKVPLRSSPNYAPARHLRPPAHLRALHALAAVAQPRALLVVAVELPRPAPGQCAQNPRSSEGGKRGTGACTHADHPALPFSPYPKPRCSHGTLARHRARSPAAQLPASSCSSPCRPAESSAALPAPPLCFTPCAACCSASPQDARPAAAAALAAAASQDQLISGRGTSLLWRHYQRPSCACGSPERHEQN